MSRIINKVKAAELRKKRVRSSISGTAECPRLSVHVSNLHITAQLIDDVAKKTLAYSSTIGTKVDAKTMTEKAEYVGADIAKKATNLKIKQAVFDRGSKLYHGRVKALADSARKGGLKF